MKIIEVVSRVSDRITAYELRGVQILGALIGAVILAVLVASAMEALSLPTEKPPTRWMPK